MLLAHMADNALLKLKMVDGSRHFASQPERRSWRALQRHLAQLPGATLGEFISDHVTEAWIDFRYEGHEFTVNNQSGEYWFFVRDPACPESTLERVRDHCVPFLSSGSWLSTIADAVRDALRLSSDATSNRHHRNI
jgi:hypothetical protein